VTHNAVTTRFWNCGTDALSRAARCRGTCSFSFPRRSVWRGILLYQFALAGSTPAVAQHRSVRLEDLTWKQAAAALTPRAVVVIPLGAASKEHGKHLKLSFRFWMAFCDMKHGRWKGGELQADYRKRFDMLAPAATADQRDGMGARQENGKIENWLPGRNPLTERQKRIWFETQAGAQFRT
jgi:hypothetical protein